MGISYYYDENKTIYANSSDLELAVAAGASANVTLGLDDLTELSGQSTILINRIHFQVTMYVDFTVLPDSLVTATVLGGITPAGFINPTGTPSNLANLSDYQEIKGWPLKGVQRFLTCRQPNHGSPTPATNSLIKASFSKTWTPSRKNALALNRGQEIVLNVQTNHQEADYSVNMILEARRGE